MNTTRDNSNRSTSGRFIRYGATFFSSHQKRIIWRWLLACTMGILLAIPVANADQPVWFFDHFTDGNVHDDAPISWYTGGYGETLSVVDGDLLLKPQSELAAAVVDDAVYQNVSLLTRLKVSNRSFTNVGLIARQDGAIGYTAGISGNRYGVYDHSLILTYGGLSKSNLEVLASTPTSLDPSTTDVLLQFEIMDDSLSLFAWADGTPRPSTPQLNVHDSRISQGAIGTFFDNDSSRTTAVFRELLAMPGHSGADNLTRSAGASDFSEYPHAAIPEPSTGTIAFAWLAIALHLRFARRSKRYVT